MEGLADDWRQRGTKGERVGFGQDGHLTDSHKCLVMIGFKIWQVDVIKECLGLLTSSYACCVMTVSFSCRPASLSLLCLV